MLLIPSFPSPQSSGNPAKAAIAYLQSNYPYTQAAIPLNMELNLRFPEINQVIIRLDDLETDRLNFTSPLAAEDLEDIRWYFEVYANSYTA